MPESKNILIVTGGNNAGEFLRLLGNGVNSASNTSTIPIRKGRGVLRRHSVWPNILPIMERLSLSSGDNIIEKNIRKAVDAFRKQKDGARILLKEVPDPQRFGVPVFEGDRIVRVEEKPAKPASQYAVIGIYMYDERVFDFIKTLKPSQRGELEITDVNNFYIHDGKMEWDIIDGWWSDAGTFESLQYAGNMVAKTGANTL